MSGWKRPTLETKFHIDEGWWQSNGKDLRVAVRGQLCKECQARYPDHRNTESVDWVDPDTAEVVRADALMQALRNHCSHNPDFVGPANPAVTNVFRVFLLSANQPQSPVELQRQLPWTSAETILRTLSGGQVFMGLRPSGSND